MDFPRGQECPFCPFWRGKQRIRPIDEDDDFLEEDDADEDTDAEGATEAEDELDEEHDDDPDDDSFEHGGNDWDEVMGMNAVLGEEEDFDKAVDKVLAHLKENLKLPCVVSGTEDFNWEERYVIGGWSPREYRELKKTQPSYVDRYELIAIDRTGKSEWMLFSEDIGAHVRRIRDGKEFVLGLCELKVIDRRSENYRLLDDYASWFVNCRG